MLKNNLKANLNVNPNTDFEKKLKKVLPEFFTADKYDDEGNIIVKGSFDLEKFKSHLQERNLNELNSGYRLDFIGKDYARKQAGESPVSVIVPNNDHNEKEGNSGSDNLIFSGDNLEVLRHLQNVYTNSVDVIYIDPPYNTGNDGFVYPDKFEYDDQTLKDMFGMNDEELIKLKSIQDKSTHSAWLTFMYPRLYLANKLLKESGVMFISIADNEQANLKLLMDEIFGENAFIDTIMDEMSKAGGMKVSEAKERSNAKNGEYILIYSKNVDLVERQPLYDFIPGFDTHYSIFLKNDSHDVVNLVDVLNENAEVKAEMTRLTNNSNRFSLREFARQFDKSEVLKEFAIENRRNIVRERTEIPIISPDIKRELIEGKWMVYETEEREYFIGIKNDRIVQYATLENKYNHSDDFNSVYGRTVIRGDYWKGFWRDMGNISKEDNVEYKNGKKPIRLIKQLIKWSGIKDGIVMDFFAGSGTTGAAVLYDNHERNLNNSFILVQLPEDLEKRLEESTGTAKNDIKKLIKMLEESGRRPMLDELTKERISRAINNLEVKNIGYKHYSVTQPNQLTLKDIESFDIDSGLFIDSRGQFVNIGESGFDDMITPFSSEKLNVIGNADG